jgi:ribonucleoside-diphosphate reductase alpha subunit
MMLRVCKRDGRLEEAQFQKVTDRIEYLRKGFLPDGTSIGQPLEVSSNTIAKEVISKIADKITTSELDEFAAKFCASLATEDYQYCLLGGRIAASNHQKNTISSFSETVRLLYENKRATQNSGGAPVPYPLLNRTVYKFVQSNARDLEAMIHQERDYIFDYFGFETLKKAYFLRRLDGALTVCETPQHMYMRVAVALTVRNGSARLSTREAKLAQIKLTYDALSLGKYSHASPTMFNAGTHTEQLSSCYLLGIGDSMVESGGIPDCWKACAEISKVAGGIGVGIQPIRASGSEIAGTGGKSDGIVPMIRVFNDIARYVNQGGRRPGAIKMSIEPWHGDIQQFLDLKKNIGAEEQRARDLTYALWMPDLFMRRLQESITTGKEVNWSLMCPNMCPGLYTTYGDEFEALYTKYESEGRFLKQVKIKDLWNEILTAQKETGGPDILYKDSINRKSNQKNLGVIRNSNLCSEILEYSDENEYAVCNLASISLSAFVKKDVVTQAPYFDFEDLHGTCKIAHQNLDHIIDINFYPMEKCRKSNLMHRPVGLGTQGFADALLALGLSFETTTDEEKKLTVISEDTRLFNRKVAETMYHACIESSMELARDREDDMIQMRELYKKGELKFLDNGLDVDEASQTQSQSQSQSQTVRARPILKEILAQGPAGTYSSYMGSPTSEGKLQYHLWGVDPLPGFLDWTALLKQVARYGLRNSLVRADMPTASTAQVLGNSECTEPYKYCIYTRRVTAGEFIVVNKYLHCDLKGLNLWTPQMKKDIIRYRGSIQEIKQIPLHIRDRYRTAFEIRKRPIQILAAERGAFIDQTQSMNYFVSRPTNNILTNIHLGAWTMGLKTGMYYLRREPVEHPIQFTVEKGFMLNGTSGDPKECSSCSA